MKSFLLKLLIYVLLCILADYSVGIVFDNLRTSAISGANKKNTHVWETSNEDILIFGSSRALDHYIPQLFEDSLKLSCYNCGEDASGITLFFPRWKSIKQRYTPKYIIYDIYNPDFLIIDKTTNYVTKMTPYYGRNKLVDSLLESEDRYVSYKMLSKCYRYNSQLYDLLLDRFRSNDILDKGFYTVNNSTLKEGKYAPIKYGNVTFDDKRINMFECFIKDVKGKTKLIISISPIFKGTDESIYTRILDLAKMYDVPVLNHLNDTAFTEHREYFANPIHMNTRGAEAYTNTIVEEFRKLTNN